MDGAIDLEKSESISLYSHGILEVSLLVLMIMFKGLTDKQRKKGLKMPLSLLMLPAISL